MYRNDDCFGCGVKNPMGLQLKIDRKGQNGVGTHFVSQKKHQGWPGIQHGGVTSALLDEVSGYVPNFMGFVAVTAELKVSYAAPIHVGERLEITAGPVRVNRRLIDVWAKIVGEDGELKAESLAKMKVLTEDQRESIGLNNLA